MGFMIAAPVGPIGLMCIRRSMLFGAPMGFATGIGSAIADTVYGAIAAFGLTSIIDMLFSQKMWIHGFGAMIVGVMGLRMLMDSKNQKQEPVLPSSTFQCVSSSFLLTLTNPTTLVAFLAAFAMLGVHVSTGTWVDALLMTLGVFSGASLWWTILSLLSAKLKDRIRDSQIAKINFFSGIVMISFAVFAVISVWRSLGQT